MSSSRHPYIALTPVHDASPGLASPTDYPERDLSVQDFPIPQHSSWQSFKRIFDWTILSARAFTRDNAGLLLVVCAQVLSSLMNVGVKKLHNIDPPVPPLQVGSSRGAIPPSLSKNILPS